jgi:hypothetical protein
MERIAKLIEDQKTLLMQYVFAIVLVIFMSVLVVYALWHKDIRSLWIATGMSAIVLLLLAKDKGASLFLSVMLIGTLVAREEFILDAAAVVRGEKLQEVRKSRIGAPSYDNAESSMDAIRKEIELVLSKSTKEDPKALASKVIDAAERAKIESDKTRLNDAAKAVVKMLAIEGPTSGVGDDDKWQKYVKGQGLDSVEGSQQLIGQGYLKTTGSCGSLTSSGVMLAESLGLKPVSQDKDCAETPSLRAQPDRKRP